MVGDRKTTPSSFPLIARTSVLLCIAIQPIPNPPTSTNLLDNGPLHRTMGQVQVYESASGVLRGSRDPARRQVAHPRGWRGDSGPARGRVRLLHQPPRTGAGIPHISFFSGASAPSTGSSRRT